MLVPLRSVTRLLVALPRTTLTASPAAVLAAHWTPPPLELETNSQGDVRNWINTCPCLTSPILCILLLHIITLEII
ncbi:hypothetical protein MTP99_006939 [Tenebrio molitor]|nr:hypothetical protein MTP99_006939 [Tenebrio molitor]